MKQIFIFSFVMLFANSVLANSGLFKLDLEEVVIELQEVYQLEQFVMENEGITFSDLATIDHPLVQQQTAISQIAMKTQSGPFGLPPFFWGCFAGPVGILIVYVLGGNDMDQARAAFWGCVIAALIVPVLQIFFVLGQLAAI
jgi:hypothetical protein